VAFGRWRPFSLTRVQSLACGLVSLFHARSFPQEVAYARRVSDPYYVPVATAELSRLASALDVVDKHAVLNHRYRKLIAESQQTLAGDEIRLTQARGLAKRLMVLVKAAGPSFRAGLEAEEGEAVNAGLAQAEELVRSTD
jgi:hypothetical protein